jgi:hypothetical protein
MALPDWLAVIEQVPWARMVTVVPDTVQMDVEFDVKSMVRPDVVLALSAGGVEPIGRLLRELKVMVCAVEPVGDRPSTSRAGVALTELEYQGPAELPL